MVVDYPAWSKIHTIKIPDWFKEGLIAYLGEEWSVKTDTEFRDLLQTVSNSKKKFETLARDHPRLMGMRLELLPTRSTASPMSPISSTWPGSTATLNPLLYILGIPFEQIASSTLIILEKLSG
ncbi:MAG: hypothetical protein IPK94_05635 [Saprospiraceae bacterium]|nr:hypothetical protein [Saprospiraceae bacterium]